MRVMIRCGAIAALLLMASPVSVFAGQFFERDGLAIMGYDPVAYVTDRKAVKGSPDLAAEYVGSTFYFSTEVHREAFAKNPERFVPQYGGYCAYGMAKGYKAVIDPDAFTVVGDKLYFNYSERVRAQWLLDVPGYIRKADANWPEVRKLKKVQE